MDYQQKRELLEKAARQLARSDRGRDAMRGIEIFLRGPARALDGDNRRALILLLSSFYEDMPGTVIEYLEQYGTPEPNEDAPEG